MMPADPAHSLGIWMQRQRIDLARRLDESWRWYVHVQHRAAWEAVQRQRTVYTHVVIAGVGHGCRPGVRTW